jgi:hypothetical protein
MPNLNNISVKEGEFTAMQEKATAFIFKRSYLPPKKRFKSAEDIVKDKDTVKGLKEIFVFNNKQLFNYTLPWSQNQEKVWFETFYKQHEKILDVFPNAKFTIFDRDDKNGFMEWFQKLIKDYFRISKKDSYNPADIWLIDKKEVNRKTIIKELNQDSATRTLTELNQVMRSLYNEKKVVGLSLKLVSGQTAKYERVNLDDKFFKDLEAKKGVYDYKLSDIKMDLTTIGSGKRANWKTQDTVISLSLNNSIKVKFQVKGNGTSKFENLKIEGTGVGEKARLGKAPLLLISKLTSGKPYKKTFQNRFADFPKDTKEFIKQSKKYNNMFSELVANCKKNNIRLVTNILPKDFTKQMKIAFDGEKPWIANSKLMQLTFVHTICSMVNKDMMDEYVTDILFLSKKEGRNIFQFGPFGKLY